MSYVYMLIDSRNNEPFYVGKGIGSRCYSHVKEAIYYPEKRSLKLNKIRSILNDGYEVIIKKVENNVSDLDAIDFECLLISEIRDFKFSLTNMTDGGDGAQGYKHTDEHKQKMKILFSNRVITDKHRQNMRKPKSEEGRANIAKARLTSKYKPSKETKDKTSKSLIGRVSPMKGRTQSEEAKLKMSIYRKGLPKLKIECAHCFRLIAVNMAKRWHFDNCKEKK